MEQIKEFLRKLNEKGIILPLIHDPKTKSGSVSLTLVVISSIYVQVAILNKFANIFDGVDADVALYWFMSCSALYWSRNISGSKSNMSFGDKVEVEEDVSESEAEDCKPKRKKR